MAPPDTRHEAAIEAMAVEINPFLFAHEPHRRGAALRTAHKAADAYEAALGGERPDTEGREESLRSELATILRGHSSLSDGDWAAIGRFIERVARSAPALGGEGEPSDARFKAGQIVLSGDRACRVLGPPVSKPIQMWSMGEDEDDPGEMVDRLALPIEPIPLPSDSPSGGHWIDESCFDSLQLFVADAGRPDQGREEREGEAVIAVEEDWTNRYRHAVPIEAWERAVRAGYDAALAGQPGVEEHAATRWRDRLLGTANCIHGVRLYRDCSQCAANAEAHGPTCDHCGKRVLEPMHGEDGFTLCPKCSGEMAQAFGESKRDALPDDTSAQEEREATFVRGDRVKGTPGLGTVVLPSNSAGNVGVYWDSNRLNVVEWPRASLLTRAARTPQDVLDSDGDAVSFEPTDEQVEKGARAAFFRDDVGGHIKGRWTYDTIPEEGRDNYRALVRDVLRAVAPEHSNDEVERLRDGLEAALSVSFTVGLLRARASEQKDAELALWGEKLKAQLVGIREVLSPGTAAFMAEHRAASSPTSERK